MEDSELSVSIFHNESASGVINGAVFAEIDELDELLIDAFKGNLR